MRPLRTASPLVRVIATLGVLVTLQSIAVLRYGSTPKFVTSELPTDVWRISGEIVISADRVILLGIAALLSARAVDALPLHALRAGDERRGRERARRVVARLVAGPHRDDQLGARLRRSAASPRS